MGYSKPAEASNRLRDAEDVQRTLLGETVAGCALD